MKRLVPLLLMTVALFSCSKEKETPNYSEFKAILKPQAGTLKALTNDQVYEQAWAYQFNTTMETMAFKDEVKKELYIPSFHIINSDNTLYPDSKGSFLSGESFVVINADHKVIAYVPNATMRKAQRLITDAFNKGRMDSCVFYLQNVYKFIPIDDAEWRDLKKNGLN
jgi:hypothetical protein